MKWFKHETDAYTSLKVQILVNHFGLEGVGYYWCCLELVGREGKNFKIKAEKDWKNHFKKFLGIDDEKQNKILSLLADKDFIDKKGLNKGDLFIPKLAERADEYTKRVRRLSEHSTDNVPVEEKRLEEKRLDKKRREKKRKIQINSSLSYLKNIPEEDTKEFIDKFNIDESQLKEKADDLVNYCQAKNKHYANYKAFLRNAIKRDFGIRIKPNVKIKYEEVVDEKGHKVMRKVEET